MRRGFRKGFHFDRVGLGEWLIGVSSVALIVVLFSVKWFTVGTRGTPALDGSGRETQLQTGWASLGLIGPLTLVVCIFGIGVFWAALTRRSPALPMAAAVIQAPFALAALLAILLRVLVYPPQAHAHGVQGGEAMQSGAGAYLGLALSILMAVGVYLTFRREGVAPGDAPRATEVVDVSETPRVTRA